MLETILLVVGVIVVGVASIEAIRDYVRNTLRD